VPYPSPPLGIARRFDLADRGTCLSGNLVLIVDDNPVNLKLVQELVACEGYDVDTAEDAREALDRLAVRRPKLILMDIQMPGMDGLALTRRLKADPARRATSSSWR